MRLDFRLAVALPTLALLAGCAGKNFVRPPADAFRLGKTTREQVVAVMGEPRGEGSATKQGVTVQSINYVYASVGGEAAEDGVVPARGMFYHFAGDVLVGQEFVSSFKADSSNFDETKASAIVKGTTTRAEVAKLLGAPSSQYLPPMVKETSGEAVGYIYQTTRGSAFSGFKVFRKALVVTFDSQDRVKETELVQEGTK